MMLNLFKSKIQSHDEIHTTVADWKAKGHKVVFTNGCFDILHYGHIHYLAEARDLGTKLVIGLNSKNSVKRLKGEHRPINDDSTRLYVLAALQCVDAVVVFEEDTPLNLIKKVHPNILVKGGDYTLENIVGAKWLLENEGEVKSLAFVDGYSTTATESRMKGEK